MPGGIFGSLMSGMSRGMMNGGMGGEMNRARNQKDNSNSNNSDLPNSISQEVYDVDRWKRSDDSQISAIEQVRADWEGKKKQSKKTSILNRFHKKENTQQQIETEQQSIHTQGTIDVSHTNKKNKKVEKYNNKNEPNSKDGAYIESQQTEIYKEHQKENYLGLHSISTIDSFFTQNPVNSALLSIDTLSMGSLTLNQVENKNIRKTNEISCTTNTEMKQEKNHGYETSYMSDVYKKKQDKKYDVKIL